MGQPQLLKSPNGHILVSASKLRSMECLLWWQRHSRTCGNRLCGNQALLTWTKANGIKLDHLMADDKESFTSRYEAYLTDYRIEPRKLLWQIELSIKIAD